MNDFDQAARFLLKIDPLGFLRWLIAGLDPIVRFTGWLDTRTLVLPGGQDRVCDTVAELALGPGSHQRWALVLEIQPRPDPEILDRLLEYLARLRRELRYGPRQRERYQVAAAVVNLTGPPQSGLLEMALPAETAVGLKLQAVVRSLRGEDAGAVLDGMAQGQISRVLLPWVPLMSGGSAPGTMERWKEVAGAEPQETLRATYGALVLVFAELARKRTAWRKALEGWNVTKSKVVEEWRAEGKAEGRTEGKAEGRYEARREDIVRLLRLRLPEPVPPELIDAVNAQVDREELERWFDLAVTATSLKDFRKAAGV